MLEGHEIKRSPRSKIERRVITLESISVNARKVKEAVARIREERPRIIIADEPYKAAVEGSHLSPLARGMVAHQKLKTTMGWPSSDFRYWFTMSGLEEKDGIHGWFLRFNSHRPRYMTGCIGPRSAGSDIGFEDDFVDGEDKWKSETDRIVRVVRRIIPKKGK